MLKAPRDVFLESKHRQRKLLSIKRNAVLDPQLLVKEVRGLLHTQDLVGKGLAGKHADACGHRTHQCTCETNPFYDNGRATYHSAPRAQRLRDHLSRVRSRRGRILSDQSQEPHPTGLRTSKPRALLVRSLSGLDGGLASPTNDKNTVPGGKIVVFAGRKQLRPPRANERVGRSRNQRKTEAITCLVGVFFCAQIQSVEASCYPEVSTVSPSFCWTILFTTYWGQNWSLSSKHGASCSTGCARTWSQNAQTTVHI